MRPGSDFAVSAPSKALLRFLRCQSEEVCFFTPSKVTTCQSTRTARIWTAPKATGSGHTNTIRGLKTTPRRQATVESSLFNFDILRPIPKPRPPIIDPLRHEESIVTFGLLPTEALSNGRRVSTEARPLLGRLWKQRERKEKPYLKQSDLPPLPSFLDDVGGTSLGRNKPGKAGNELKLRCTEFDSEGKVTLMDGEFKKTELIAKV